MTLADLRKQQGVEAKPEADDGHGGDHAHPGPLEYAQIGVVLAIITAVEVALYYIDIGFTPLVLVLIVLSAAKFLFVVLWFMHLKFDNRLFSTMFAGGFVLALALFVVVLSTIGGQLV
jgi:cytochrome c oxidase subunit 4